MAANKLAFLSMRPPENYVAGLGRGATGFVTRSDIGPAKEGPDEETVKAELERRAAAAQDGNNGAADDDERFQDPENDAGLFATDLVDKEDEEAEAEYARIDAKLDRRRKAKREARDRIEEEEYDRLHPKISAQFEDLKRGLANVSESEWAAIPEVGDLTGKNRRRQQAARMEQRSYAAPDSLMAGAHAAVQHDQAIEATTGDQTPAGNKTDFVEMGAARDKVLGLRLDQAYDSLGTQTNIDPKGYLTSLNSIVVKSDTEIGDIKKARLLLNSVISTNPKHAPGWIAAARLEEHAGKTVKAREIIERGTKECQANEDVWLEAVRLNTLENGKIILAEAVQQIPESVRIWLAAMKLETTAQNKKRVLRKALEFIPQSVTLWKEAVNLEDTVQDARIMLARATELIPLSVELWLALARLESYENARKVLNRARTHVRTSHEIWIAAARLEEQQGHDDRVDKIIDRATRELQAAGGILDREQWILEAEKCEKESAVLTCQAIIKSTLGQGLDPEEQEDTFTDDATNCISHGNFETARAVFAYMLRLFPERRSIWRRAADMEKVYGNRETLMALLEKAVQACPHSEALWLMYAKEKWISHDVPGARNVLDRAFEHNPNNEDIWLAAVKLEAENGEQERARFLMDSARKQAGTDRVWKTSVVLEREYGNLAVALDLVDQGLALYPKFDKLNMLKGQLYEDMDQQANAREAFTVGRNTCPKSVPLWILSARAEERAGNIVKSRAILDQARLANVKNAILWCEAIRVEQRANNTNQAKVLMAKALQECPKSGLLWSEAIFMEARTARKSRSVDALRKVDDEPPVLITAVARLFWIERKLDKGRTWFEKVVAKLDPDYGDAWAWYYKLETEEDKRQEILLRCVQADPHHGEAWQAIAKRPENARKKTDEILKLVAASL